MNKYNLFSPNTDNQTLADSLYKSKKKTKKRKIRILPFFIKKMPQNTQILTLRICNIWFKKLVNWEISNKYREVKPFWTSRLFEADWSPKNFSEIHIKNWYQPNSPLAIYDFWGIQGQELHEWKLCYKIKLGKLKEIRNFEK